MVQRQEKVYILYGSQTGNSEQAAQEVCDQMRDKLSSTAIQKMASTRDEIHVQPVCMQLDDFLELERCQWTRLTVIITSSYGVGQAPLGCYRFRQLCDAWSEQHRGNTNKNGILKGLKFALCGLGDSKYRTYFENPTKLNDTLTNLGAERVGPLGKADASGTGSNLQSKVIEEWINNIWPFLAKAVAESPVPDDVLKEMQKKTVNLCRKINPDFPAPKNGYTSMFILALVVILVALLVSYLNKDR